MPEDTECLVRRLIGGDTEAAGTILAAAPTSTSPVLLVAAALVTANQGPWLSRAAAQAATTRDRQLVAVAIAHFGADDDLLDALVRDHLADYPESILAAWISTQHGLSGPTSQPGLSGPTSQHGLSGPTSQHGLSGPTTQNGPSRPTPTTSGSHHV